MQPSPITIENFIEQYFGTTLLIDVRSPSEYAHAHIPSAFSLPLFTDDERKIIGTTYKRQSREKAVKIGLDYFGPKMSTMIKTVEQQLKSSSSDKIILHCARGGMRSEAVAWLLSFYGFDVIRIKGGYKSFRNWVLQQFEKPYPIRVLSGYTGSGKTEILNALMQHNEAVIDLEAIAGHKGSAFGDLGLERQGSNEFFENKLALELYRLTQNMPNQPIWFESESIRIGNVSIPHALFQQLRAKAPIQIIIPFEERLKKVLNEYGHFDKTQLINATLRISKRLGPENTQKTVAYLNHLENDKAFEILMRYYDKYYASSKLFQEAQISINLPNTNVQSNTATILKHLN